MITKSTVVRELFLELAYTAASAVFLFKLNNLNKVLLSLNLDSNPVELVAYADGKPVKYFIITLLLGLIGVFLIIRKFRHIKYDMTDSLEMLLSLAGILIVAIIIVLLWIFIDNPIARAVILLFAVAGGIVLANS